MNRIGFVSYPGVPDLTPDDRLAFEPLAELGYQVEPVQWEDPGVQWRAYSAVVIRSCWNYHLKPAEFAEWVERMGEQQVPLWNPAPLVRWNMDKTYLRDLEREGVEIPATAWPVSGDSSDLGSLLADQGWDRAVVKPTISGSAYLTWVTTAAEAAKDSGRFRAMLAERGVMVQRFEDAVAGAGEWSLIFLGGELSHAVVKHPKPGDFRVQKDHGGSCSAAPPPREARKAADAILARVAQPWLYARVDLVESGGRWLLMELEMLEPDLFLRTDSGAPARWARAIARVATD